LALCVSAILLHGSLISDSILLDAGSCQTSAEFD